LETKVEIKRRGEGGRPKVTRGEEGPRHPPKIRKTLKSTESAGNGSLGGVFWRFFYKADGTEGGGTGQHLGN